MSIEKVRAYLKNLGAEDRIIIFDASTATVALAAAALGCEEAHIAKTMSFLVAGSPVLVVLAGDVRVDNHKFKQAFHKKGRMIPFAEVEGYIGHAPGGVCPFAIQEGVPVYLDISLKRFATVYPAAGDDHSAVRVTPDELFSLAKAAGWVDVAKYS
ncbi:YbaK/EbsC family protein [uncultured Mitsuokella sp.]|uniref:YbaK/EbsC family protein n=1 Tax=uncultured Mitsuokella sp. TaxID=453120 RepID=UPI0025D9F29E|nr:YbaK/EbsC family protein [uncultured Mitsuokella sp.]